MRTSLGGRSLTAWVIAGSLMLTNLSTEHLIGLNGDAFKHTIAVTAWETTAALAMVGMALYFPPPVPADGTVDPSGVPRQAIRPDNRSDCSGNVPVLVRAGHLAGGPAVRRHRTSTASLNCRTLFGLSQGTGHLAPGLGRGDARVSVRDFRRIEGRGGLRHGQRCRVPIRGAARTAARAHVQIGDGNPWSGLTEVYAEERPKFDITGDEPGSFLPFGVLFTGMVVNQIFFWCAGQQIIQRGLGARSLKEGQKGVLIAACFKLLGPLVIVLPGVLAYHLFKDTLGPEDYLLAYPTLVKAVLPAWLGGLFAAVMVGAVLSTFNSVLNSSATLFCRDIYAAVLRPSASPRELVKAGRACSVVLAIAAMSIAPLIDTSGSLYNYLQRINATFFGPMLAVLLLGMLDKRVSASSARAGLVGGPVLFFLLVFSFDAPVQAFLQGLLGTADEVHFLHFLGLVFVVVVAFMLLVSWLRPERSHYVEPGTPPVDMTPWKHAKALGAFVCVCTVACYVLLAQ